VTDAATAAAPPFAHDGAGVDGEVFVSYSRRDGDFVGRLRRALEAAGKSVWVDTEDIPAATRWSDRIRQALEGAAAVVFVITPDSIVSAECDKELDAALAANKRIVPVRLRPVDPAATRSEIRELQWLHVPDGAVSESLVEAVIAAVDTDHEWIDDHRRIYGRAREWQDEGRDRSFLLRGRDLEDAEDWFASSARHAESPTDLHGEYIRTSRRAASRRQRLTLAVLLCTLLLIASVAAVALIQRGRAQRAADDAEARALAAQAMTLLPTDPLQGLRLAVDSIDKRWTAQGRDALRATLGAAPAFEVQVRGRAPGSPEADALFSPDGKLLLALGGNAPTVWTVATGRRLAVLGDRTSSLPPEAYVAFSADSRLLVVKEDDGFRIWRVSTGRKVAFVPMIDPEVAVFSPDGGILVCSGRTGTTLWSTRPWSRVRTFRNAHVPAFGTDVGIFSADGRRLALSTNRAFIEVDTNDWRHVATYQASPADHEVLQIAYGNDGETVVTTSTNADYNFDSTTLTIHSRTGSTTRRFDLPGEWLDPRFSRDGRYLSLVNVSGGTSQRRVTFWRTDRWERIVSRDAMALSPDWTFGVRMTGNGMFEVVDISTAQTVARLPAPNAWTAVVGADRAIATASRDGKVRVWTTQAPELWGPPSAFSPRRGSFIAAGDYRADTHYVDAIYSPDRDAVAIGDTVWQPHATKRLLGVAPNGRFLFAQADVASGFELSLQANSRWPGKSKAWSANGRLAAVSADHLGAPRMLGVRVYDTGTWQPSTTRGGPNDPISGAVFSADGEWIMSRRLSVSRRTGAGARYWFRDTGVVVWNVAKPTDAYTVTIVHPAGAVVGARAISRHGTYVAVSETPPSVLLEGRTTVWQTAEADRHFAVTGTFLDFSADERHVITRTNDGAAHVFELEDGGPVMELSAPGLSEAAAFDADGRSIVAVGADRVVRAFGCPACAPIGDLRADAERRLATRR
jgi:WD40 repeat protein